jgi:serine/threonine protein phosphatase PrpC
MAVVCPACGGTTLDAEFCDHCNAELTPRAAAAAPTTCFLTQDLTVALTPFQVEALAHPEAAALVETSGQRWRLHWISQTDWPARSAALQLRVNQSCAALPPCRLIEDQAGVWLAAEVQGRRTAPWEQMPADPRERLHSLVDFLGLLAAALEELHAADLVWLTFDPAEMELLEGVPPAPARLRFTNLDLRVFPARTNPERLEVLPTFAAPEVCRFQVDELGPRTDVFHLALFAYYWLAGLLPGGFAGRGLEAFAFAVPPLRLYAPSVPPGVARALAPALEIDPGRRYACPSEVAAALRHALEEADRRWDATDALRWELGAHTRTGRCKEALGLANEDHILVRQLAEPERALLAVADGISICDVGSGALASWLTCLVLDNSFGADSRAASFPEQIVAACHRAAEGLLEWALAKGHGQALESGANLMGTTLTAAWLEGNRLQLANVGDSRAYLITAEVVEQLTVDGDVACTLLAAGMPPEEVLELGRMGKALHGCVGSVGPDPAGQLKILEAACTPRLSSWTLLPGDVVVLCSDGLVEEGAALEPAELAEIVRRHAELPAAELPLRLAEAADARQQLPSPLEPDGFGDNISCIIIKIGPTASSADQQASR